MAGIWVTMEHFSFHLFTRCKAFKRRAQSLNDGVNQESGMHVFQWFVGMSLRISGEGRASSARGRTATGY